MKFSTTAAELLAVLDQARAATSASATLVAYAGVQLQVRQRQLTVTGSDGELTIASTTKVANAVDGQVLLPPGPLAGLLKAVPPAAAVAVELDGDVRVVVDGLHPYVLRPVSATFPAPSPVRGQAADADFTGLDEAYAAVRAAVGREVAGVQLESDDDGLHLRATDNYRLHAATLPTGTFRADGTTVAFSGVLPAATLPRLAALGKVTVQADAHGRVLKVVSQGSPSTTVTTRLLGVPFPAVGAMINAEHPSSCSVPVEAARRALARLGAVTDTAPVAVSVEAGTLRLSASNIELGTGQEEIAVSGDDLSFVVSRQYLVEALGAHRAEHVTFGWSSPLHPVHIASDAPFPVRCVVMPIRA